MKHLYVMLSHTNTGFGRLIRRVSRCHYNHAAIAFDEDLAQLYSFARKLHDIPLSAGLTRETPAMYAMGQQQVDVIIYRVPVSDQDYTVARRTVQMMCRDGDYIYNVLSAITFPVLHGLSVYKACTCSEFTAGILRAAGLPLDKPDCAWHPEDFIPLLEQYEIYRGNLLTYRCFDYRAVDPEFFRQHSLYQVLSTSAVTLCRVLNRELLEHPYGPPSVILPKAEEKADVIPLWKRPVIALFNYFTPKAM